MTLGFARAEAELVGNDEAVRVRKPIVPIETMRFQVIARIVALLRHERFSPHERKGRPTERP
jgi:hypothetical protein